MNVNRVKFTNEIQQFIDKYKKKLDDILDVFNWSHENLQKPEDKGNPEAETKNTEEKNEFSNSENMRKYEIDDPSFDGQVSILDKLTEFCHKLCPLSPYSKDSETLYNELVASLPQPKSKCESKSKKEILVEMLKLERDAKRRRISYKNKVHTKNKSHTEVMRELVQQQMEVLTGASEEPTSGGRQNMTGDKELMDVGIVKGNPHLAWQKIGDHLEERDKRKKKDDIKEEDGSRKRREEDGERRNDKGCRSRNRERRSHGDHGSRRNHSRSESYREGEKERHSKSDRFNVKKYKHTDRHEKRHGSRPNEEDRAKHRKEECREKKHKRSKSRSPHSKSSHKKHRR